MTAGFHRGCPPDKMIDDVNTFKRATIRYRNERNVNFVLGMESQMLLESVRQ